MHARKYLPASFALALVLAGCASAPPAAPPDTRDADAKAIRQLESEWSQAEPSKDVNKITSYYADDASLMVSDMPIVTGKQNIVVAYGAMLKDPNFSLSFTTNNVVVSRAGDGAYSRGTYSLTMTDAKTKKVMSEKGKYVTIYGKQADGNWKAVVDISNSDAPAVPVSPQPKH